MICPICQGSFMRKGGSFVCENNHCFDISKEGYINLLLNQQKKTKDPGDSPEMMQARSDFLRNGYYEKAATAVLDQIQKHLPNVKNLLDAGCGEGYYTGFLAEKLPFAQVDAIDISKSGVKKAAKEDKKSQYVVGSIFHLPYPNKTFDVITNIFAPFSEDEFARVLNDEGLLVIACAGKEHLRQLRNIIYENEQGHKEKEFNLKGFDILERTNCKYAVELTHEALINLFKMTPYYFQAPLDKKEQILQLEKLTLTVDFEIIVFEKRRSDVKYCD